MLHIFPELCSPGLRTTHRVEKLHDSPKTFQRQTDGTTKSEGDLYDPFSPLSHDSCVESGSLNRSFHFLFAALAAERGIPVAFQKELWQSSVGNQKERASPLSPRSAAYSAGLNANWKFSIFSILTAGRSYMLLSVTLLTVTNTHKAVSWGNLLHEPKQMGFAIDQQNLFVRTTLNPFR